MLQFGLINGMVKDSTGGTLLKKHLSYNTFSQYVTGNTSYDITGHTVENIVTGDYILPYVNLNLNYMIDTEDESICVILPTGETITDWTTNYINSLVSSEYTNNIGDTIEHRIIFDSLNDKLYKFEYSIDFNHMDQNERYAIVDENYQIITGNTFYYIDELDQCGEKTGRKIILTMDINFNSDSYNNVKTYIKSENMLYAPEVSTLNIGNISNNSVVLNGNIINSGSTSIIENGFCLSNFPDPSIDDIRIISGLSNGAYSSTYNDLITQTQYYVKAYAINSIGVSYGDEITFQN